MEADIYSDQIESGNLVVLKSAKVYRLKDVILSQLWKEYSKVRR